MIKKTAVLLTFFYLFAAMKFMPASFAMSDGEAEQKAGEYHKLASKDVIFIDEELKALYYQNVQIIGLLREMKQLLRETLSGLEASLRKIEELEKKE